MFRGHDNRYDNNTGKIMIDMNVARQNRQQIQAAIGFLIAVSGQLRHIVDESHHHFTGQGGDEFRDTISSLRKRNEDSINDLRNSEAQMNALIERYEHADRELAERWRNFLEWAIS